MKHSKIWLLGPVVLMPFMAIARNWNPLYHTLSQGQYSTAESELPFYNLKGTERMLDVGCGTGKTSAFYAQHVDHGGSVLGIDSSLPMIDFARTQYHQVSNLAFECADVTTMSFDAEFDVAYSYFCLHWVEDRQAALNAIARSLKPGGRAYCYIIVESDLLAISKRCSQAIIAQYPAWKPYITNPFLLSPEQWIAHAQAAGFTIEKSCVHQKERTFTSIKEHKEYVNTIGIAQLPDADKARYVDLLIDMLYEEYGIEKDQPFTRTNNMLVLYLVKP